jgi:hypothetical protein
VGRTIVWRTYLLGDGTTADLAQVEQPHRAPTLESEILVPAAEAAISGVLFGCAATALAVWLAHAPWWPCLPIAIAVMTGGGWIAALREERQTLWKTESLSVLSSQPEVPPSPPVPSVPLLANPGECAVSAATAQRDEHVAQRRDELVAFVRTCATRGCGESAHGVTAGTRAAYLASRDLLLSLGLARWRSENHKAGWELAAPPATCVMLLRKHVIER